MYNKYIDVKIDTGSQVNILPSKLFEQLNVSAPLSAADIRLTSYSGNQLTVLGKLKIHCAYKNRYANVELLHCRSEKCSRIAQFRDYPTAWSDKADLRYRSAQSETCASDTFRI